MDDFDFIMMSNPEQDNQLRVTISSKAASSRQSLILGRRIDPSLQLFTTCFPSMRKTSDLLDLPGCQHNVYHSLICPLGEMAVYPGNSEWSGFLSPNFEGSVI